MLNHQNRNQTNMQTTNYLKSLLEQEKIRQQTTLQLIPSENYASTNVLEACASVISNKYAEGYPKKRYYQGNIIADEIEQIAIHNAKKIFGAQHVNVQPYSGSPANMAIFHSILKPGDKIMGLRLDLGGHLTHGHTVNFSSRYYKSVPYGVDPVTHTLDYEEIRSLALKEKPNIIICGATAYPRTIDFAKFYAIAKEVNAYLLADISHIAGLIAGGVHPSPIPYADFVMTTTHKTLRGPRGAIIMSKKEDNIVFIDSSLPEKDQQKLRDLTGKIDRAVFPGLQGGPHLNTIAGIAICLDEASQPEFTIYATQIIKNAQTLAKTLLSHNINLVTGGTDNHLIVIDLYKTLNQQGLGKAIAQALEQAGIITNANTIPFDPSTPFNPSGIRLGTPALTTQGMKEPEMIQIADMIATIIKNYTNEEIKQEIAKKVQTLCQKFPIYSVGQK